MVPVTSNEHETTSSSRHMENQSNIPSDQSNEEVVSVGQTPYTKDWSKLSHDTPVSSKNTVTEQTSGHYNETQENKNLEKCEECAENDTETTHRASKEHTITSTFSSSKQIEILTEIASQQDRVTMTDNGLTSLVYNNTKELPSADIKNQTIMSSKAITDVSLYGEISSEAKVHTRASIYEAHEGTTLQECEECEGNGTEISTITSNTLPASLRETTTLNEIPSHNVHGSSVNEKHTTDKGAPISEMFTEETRTTANISDEEGRTSKAINGGSETSLIEKVAIPSIATSEVVTSTTAETSLEESTTEEATSETCEETEEQGSSFEVQSTAATAVNTERTEDTEVSASHSYLEETGIVTGTTKPAYSASIPESSLLEQQTPSGLYPTTGNNNKDLESSQTGQQQVTTEGFSSFKSTTELTQEPTISAQSGASNPTRSPTTAAEEVSEDFSGIATQEVSVGTSEVTSKIIKGKEGNLEVVSNGVNIFSEKSSWHPTIYLDFTMSNAISTEKEADEKVVTTSASHIAEDLHNTEVNVENTFLRGDEHYTTAFQGTQQSGTDRSLHSSRTLIEEQNTAIGKLATNHLPFGTTFGTVQPDNNNLNNETNDSSTYSTDMTRTSELLENTLVVTSSKKTSKTKQAYDINSAESSTTNEVSSMEQYPSKQQVTESKVSNESMGTTMFPTSQPVEPEKLSNGPKVTETSRPNLMEATWHSTNQLSTENENDTMISCDDNEVATCVTSIENLEGNSKQNVTLSIIEEVTRTEQGIPVNNTSTSKVHSTQQTLLTENFSHISGSNEVLETTSKTMSTTPIYSEGITTLPENLSQAQVTLTGYISGFAATDMTSKHISSAHDIVEAQSTEYLEQNSKETVITETEQAIRTSHGHSDHTDHLEQPVSEPHGGPSEYSVNTSNGQTLIVSESIEPKFTSINTETAVVKLVHKTMRSKPK
ncbi:unnamed protein product [Callosobruchus maculatus]|uniref:Uncharacterized protein n=1 Tax=Callosobruchus maculatus TaxID=64391 RepID=A0A653D9Y2_CALMS|nr:unnamed protein product [Callosobruchus maculatus]